MDITPPPPDLKPLSAGLVHIFFLNFPGFRFLFGPLFSCFSIFIKDRQISFLKFLKLFSIGLYFLYLLIFLSFYLTLFKIILKKACPIIF
tara:strand:+ start:305 stop:574 length:270 start_codon:yes stop_codon:yes gene_type:complete